MAGKTVKFENTEIENKIPIDDEGTLAKNYADLLLLGINSAPPGGFDPKGNTEATRLYDLVDKVKGDSVIEFKLADFTKIKKAFSNLRSLARSEDIGNLDTYLDSL